MNIVRQITLEQSGIGNKLVHDYLNGEDSAKDFYDFAPNLDGLAEAIKQRKETNVDRQLLYDVFHKQYAQATPTPQVKKNIELLLQSNTFTVTTGHQLNIFTGPLFFVYKIASVIGLCKKLNDLHPGHNFVPVYWMNSEDHDFEEISSCWLRNKKYTWSEPNQSGPVGRMNLKGLENLIKGEIEPDSDDFSDVYKYALSIYKHASDLSTAHREIVDKLFGDYGLLILDQDDAELKRSFGEHIKTDITQTKSFKNVEKTNSVLSERGYNPQVYVREINYFFMGEGSRDRIVKFGDGFETAESNKQWSKEELINALNESPGDFSPNVVTRPMYQSFVLPDIAYIGGPAEVAYWLQYKENFQDFNLFFPTILLRDTVLTLDEKSLKRLQNFGISYEQIFGQVEDLVNLYVNQNHANELSLKEEIMSHKKLFEALLAKTSEVDPSMESMVKAVEKKGLNELERVEKKLRRVVKRRNAEKIAQLERIHQMVYPNGTFQERILNIFDLSISEHQFISNIIELSDCLDHRLKLVKI